jgi:hypothetical protein
MGGIHQKFGKYREALIKFEEALSLLLNLSVYDNDDESILKLIF